MKFDEVVQDHLIKPYSIIAKTYTDKHFDEVIFKKRVSRFLELVGDKGFLLDAGCGPGGESKLMVDRGYDVVGIDITPEMIEMATNKVPGVEFKKMDMRNPEFGEGTFDGVWSARALIHIPKAEQVQTLIEWKRVLKPGGILALCVLSGSGEGIEPEYYDPTGETSCFFSYFSQEELQKLIEEAGLVVIEEDEAVREGEEEAHLFIYARKEL